MDTREKINEINLYVESFLKRFGFTSVGTVNIKASFKLSNYNENFSNAFQVDSEDEVKEILKDGED